ncbi:protein kinase domain-containing protein [Streptomyces sp. NPDC001157]
MGRVWRAADEMLDRPVAVKEMRIDGLDAEDTRTRRERTLREARATARIDHPNVVRVYDVVDEGERLWIVMELVVGRSLERMMVEEGPLGPGETARIGLGLVTALRQVHARGVLHRDIKPGNVLVEDSGRRIVLTDFGIAAIQDAKALTMVGMLVGSPDYMAPERIAGRPQGPPSDVWSLGATLCAALGGRSPFSRDTTLATLHAVLYEEPELPAAAGPLRDILAALLEKDPSIRPTLHDLEEALRPIAYPAPTPTLPVGGGESDGAVAEEEGRGAATESGRPTDMEEPPESQEPPGTEPVEGADPTPAAAPAAEGTARAEAEQASGADTPGPSEPLPTIPAASNEGPTPAYLDTRLVRAARDPRQPAPAPIEDAVPQELPDTHDFGRDRPPAATAVPEASHSRTAAQQPPAPPAATAPPSPTAPPTPSAPSAPREPHNPTAHIPIEDAVPQELPDTHDFGRDRPPAPTAVPEASPSRTAAQQPPTPPTPSAPSVPPELHNPTPPAQLTAAASQAPLAPQHPNASTEVPSELRSEVRSETSSASSAPPAPPRPGVSLVRPQPVTQQRPAHRNGSDPAPLAHPGIQQSRPALGPHPLRAPQGGPLPGPTGPAGSHRGRRRAVLGAAVGLVAAGAVVAVLLLTNSGSPGGDHAGSSTSPTTSATTPPSSPSPTVEGTSRPQSLPPGAHREAGGFAWAPPQGWRRDLKTGAEVHYTSPDGAQELVAKSSLARGDLMETWQKSEQDAHQGQDYRKIRLEKTTFRGNPAVVWEYTFTLKGTPWHARLLGFDQDGKSYQINTWYQPETEAQAVKTYDKVKDSFTVL